RFELPLLIGGATTSKQHTAVKIAPEYHASVAHVLDASRAVGVVQGLREPTARAAFDRQNRAEQERLRERHKGKQTKPPPPYPVANEKRARLDFDNLPVPSFIGRRALIDYSLAEIARYIDWTFFFTAWELRGRFPAILEHPEYGAAARDLYAHAQTMLADII